MSAGAGAAGAAAGAAAGGDAGAVQGGGVNGDGQGAGENGQGFDASQIVQAFESMAPGLEEMRQQLSQMSEHIRGLPDGDRFLAETFGESGDGDGFDEGDPFGGDFDAEGLFDAGDDPGEALDPHSAAADLMGAVDGLVQERMAPIQQEVQQKLREAQLEGQVRDLLNEHPDLHDADTMRDTLDAARTIVEAAGLPLEVAHHPAIVRVVYRAGLATQQAQAEAEAAENPAQAAHLEGSGGMGAGGSRGGFVQQLEAGMDAGARSLPFP